MWPTYSAVQPHINEYTSIVWLWTSTLSFRFRQSTALVVKQDFRGYLTKRIRWVSVKIFGGLVALKG